jgi:uncharacterized protein YkwD
MLKKAFVFLTTFCLLFSAGLFVSGSVQAASSNSLIAPIKVCPYQNEKFNTAKMNNSLRCLVNYARQKSNLNQYKNLNSLNKAARLKAFDMIGCQTLGHNACGRPASFWPRRMGYFKKDAVITESVAVGYNNGFGARDILIGWLKGANRSTILSGDYEEFGTGVQRGQQIGKYKKVSTWVIFAGYRY